MPVWRAALLAPASILLSRSPLIGVLGEVGGAGWSGGLYHTG